MGLSRTHHLMEGPFTMNHHTSLWSTSTHRKYVYTVTTIALGVLIFFSQIVPSQGQGVDTLSQTAVDELVDVAAGKVENLMAELGCGDPKYGGEYYNKYSSLFRRPPYENFWCHWQDNPHNASLMVDGNWGTYWQSANVTTLEKYWLEKEGVRNQRKIRITLDLGQVNFTSSVFGLN